MEIQYMDWGQTEWHYFERSRDEQTTNLTLGISTINPYTIQKPHRHYGNEQYIYILQGQGTYVINGVESKAGAGEFLYLPPEAIHETRNPFEEPIRELIISNPVRVYPIGKGAKLANQYKDPLMAAVVSMELHEINAKDFPLMVFSARKKIIFNNEKFPETCAKHCDPWRHLKACPCMDRKMKEEEQSYRCPYGLTIYDFPLRLENQPSALLKGGFISIDTDSDIDVGLKTSRSTEQGVYAFLAQIAGGIEEMTRYHSMRKNLQEKQLLLEDREKNIAQLSTHLQKEKQKSVDLRINHHFLFNILNHFASLSLIGERQDLYEGIIDLSKMLRYSSKQDFQMATLADELDYVKIYLRLQERRYGSGLKIEINVPHGLLSFPIPFNFMQPVVENAFTHGFMEYNGVKVIKIDCQELEDKIQIEITNNGHMIDMANVSLITREWTAGSKHGLGLIYHKLSMAYGTNFELDINSNIHETSVVIQLPKGEEQ